MYWEEYLYKRNIINITEIIIIIVVPLDMLSDIHWFINKIHHWFRSSLHKEYIFTEMLDSDLLQNIMLALWFFIIYSIILVFPI